MLEYKQVLKPFMIYGADPKNGTFYIKNMKFFTSLEDYSMSWIFEREGKTLTGGFIPTLTARPGESQKITVDLGDVNVALGGELTIKLTQNNATEWADAGYEVGFEQICFEPVNATKPSLLEFDFPDSRIEVNEDKQNVYVTTGEAVYTFDKTTGLVKSIVRSGEELLASPIAPTVWRAPMDNDRRIVADWRKACYHRPIPNCLEFGITEVNEKFARIRSFITMGMPSCYPFLRLEVTYTVFAEGGMVIDTKAKRVDYNHEIASPTLPRFGFEFKMPEDYENITFFGRGPHESYEDLRHSTRLDVYKTTATDNYEHYIKPQENSAHVETRWMSITDVGGNGLMALSTNRTFSFNCCHYTPKQLTDTAHDYELVPLRETVVNIDYRNAGAGSAACGPKLDEKYRIEEYEFDFSFRLLPTNVNTVAPDKEYGRK
jgi:beta-galactosidase